MQQRLQQLVKGVGLAIPSTVGQFDQVEPFVPLSIHSMVRLAHTLSIYFMVRLTHTNGVRCS
jgi:hypothetical protein